MICDECQKRPATVHITKVQNNQKVEKHLCEQCANHSGDMGFFTWDTKLSVHDLLKGMFSHEYSDAVNRGEKACESCGMTYRDFSRTGKIGCGNCYSTFGARLEPVIRRMHGACGHTGKLPKRSGQMIGIKSRLLKLRKDLERFVQREEYEEAARVRDEIRKLEQQLQA
ncbi:MAG: UvrB/UvrC motif-containing protein [Negativicutes bacterium]|nr:UvrB/UvrC motif-containing protein [Negativicutes bacterium]